MLRRRHTVDPRQLWLPFPDLPQPLPAPPPALPSAPGSEARTWTYGHQAIAYHLKRRARARLSIRVDDRGLMVTASKSISISDIESFLLSHRAWVEKKLAQWPAAQKVRPGMYVMVLGKNWRVVTDVATQWREAPQWEVSLPALQPSVVMLEGVLKERAADYFQQRIAQFSAQMHLELPSMTLTGARHVWGQCSRDQTISLNWRLIHLAPHLVDYVVVHELAHLLEFNHSPAFWRLVAQVLPDYRTLRAELRRATYTVPRFVSS